METVSVNRQRVTPTKLILFTGLLVGSLDIGAAFVDYYFTTGKGPQGVLRFIASGIFGMKAFDENRQMIWWGLLFHFIIAYSFTILFYWLYSKINMMSLQIVLTSVLYGLFIWLLMTLVVLPLSHIPKYTVSFEKSVKAVFILICTFGFPLSWIMKIYFKNIRQQKFIEKSDTRDEF